MISYHPDSRFLTDFAAGNQPLAEAICVSAHLEFCGKCRAHVQQLKELGSTLFSGLDPEIPASDSFDRVMEQIAAGDAEVATPPTATEPAAHAMDVSSPLAQVRIPKALGRWSRRGLGDIRWAQFGKALRVAPLGIPGETRETAIYDIKAGGCMPEHEHRGEEITVLLKGSFSDADGSYSQGDFVVRYAGEAHQPTATLDTDCICLVCLERPVKPRGLFYRLAEPWVQYQLNKAKRFSLSR